ncbi:MAG: DUF6151 family protein [Alteraurantiacibacter sp.]
MPFSCRCGTLAGVVSNAGAKNGMHVVCHCADCQDFAKVLGAQKYVLDTHDGTALYQTRCNRVTFTRGKERLACLHLTRKPTLRWYAACCDTPLANTFATGTLPYFTMLLANADIDARHALGPPIGHLFVQDAANPPAGEANMSILRLVASVIPRMAKDIVSGGRRRSPLFDPGTLQPVATPRRIADERAAT